jgi:hypothetical protein
LDLTKTLLFVSTLPSITTLDGLLVSKLLRAFPNFEDLPHAALSLPDDTEVYDFGDQTFTAYLITTIGGVIEHFSPDPNFFRQMLEVFLKFKMKTNTPLHQNDLNLHSILSVFTWPKDQRRSSNQD